MTRDYQKNQVADPQNKIPLVAVTHKVVIDSFISRNIMTLTFRNSEKVNIESIYCFPTENAGALTAVNVRNTHRMHISGLEQKDKAFDYYQNALENGDSAMLLEQEQRDVFVLNLGNVPPGECIDVEIEYINHIIISEGTGSFRIPLSLPPRYVSLATDWAEQNVQSPPFALDVPYKMSVELSIRNMKCSNLRSPSHDIEIKSNKKETIVCLSSEDTAPDRDFVLDFDINKKTLPLCIASNHPNDKSYVMLKVVPTFSEWLLQHHPKKADIIFFLDCSSSMARGYLEPARKALELCLHSLSHGDYFNLITFGSEYHAFSEHPVEYSQESLDDVLDFLYLQEANMGGTEILSALQYGCSMPVAPDCNRQCVLITDGATYNTDEIINYVYRNHREQRFYTFGIGNDASYTLIKLLAETTGGVWEMIDSEKNIQETVLRQFSRMLQTKVNDIELQDSNGKKLILSKDIPVIYADDCLTVFAQGKDLRDSETLTLSIKADGEIFNCQCKIKHCGNDDAIGALWAIESILELEKQESHGENNSEISEKVNHLCKNFSIMNSKTSFIAVSMRPSYDKLSGMPKLREIPLMLNYSYESLYGKDIDITPFLHEEQVSFGSGSTPEKWYLKILKTQEADGVFRGKEIIAEVLNLQGEKLDKCLKALSNQGNNRLLEEKALTFLAKQLLDRDPEARVVCHRAIIKADSFLESDKLDEDISNQLLRIISEN